MYMRFVQLRVQPDRMADFERFYRERVATALKHTDGCLFAGLLSNDEHPSECVSMTLWRSPADVTRYESSGLYDALTRESDPYLWRTNEWRVRLTEDLTLEYERDDEPPVVDAYRVEADSSDGGAIGHATSNMYLRIVSAKAKEGRIDELVEHYERLIVPALLSVDGCRYAFGVRGNADSNEFLSITLWDSQAKALEYERHGKFNDLVAGIQDVLSTPLQWQMTLSSARPPAELSSEDIHIEGYQVVSGTSFSR